MDGFLKDGWSYFFRVCLTMIYSLQEEITGRKDVLGVLKFSENKGQMENFNDIVERGSPGNGEENFDDDDYGPKEEI